MTLGNAERKTVGTHLLEESYVSPDRVVEYFSAADMFLYPTLMDSFGLIIAESLACGCPVVSFDTGGVKEVIEHTVNGYVAQR